MKDEADGLTKLGSEKTEYLYKRPDISMLETFENRAQHRAYSIALHTSEFTSLCPKTGQPDYADIFISYSPARRCVETKSLKLYLFSFRQYGSFMEHIVNLICDDLMLMVQPKWVNVRGVFKARGGITVEVEAKYKEDAYKCGV